MAYSCVKKVEKPQLLSALENWAELDVLKERPLGEEDEDSIQLKPVIL